MSDYSDLSQPDTLTAPPASAAVEQDSPYADLSQPAEVTTQDESPIGQAKLAPKAVFLKDKNVVVGYPGDMSDEVAHQLVKEKYYDIPIVVPASMGDQAGVTRTSEGTRIAGPEEGDMSLAGQAAYVPQRILSAGIEKPAFALTNLILQSANGYYKLGRFVSEDLGLIKEQQEQTPGWLDRAVEYYSSPEEHGFFTEPAERKRAAYDEASFQRNYLLGIAGRMAETTTDLIAFFAPFIAEEKLAGAAPQMLGKGNEMTKFAEHAKKMAKVGFLTTNGDLTERSKSAMFLTAYGLTGPISNATGATGLNAVAVNTALNTFLNLGSYQEAFKQAGGANKTFFAMLIPQFMTDLAFSWHTKGTPEAQRKAMIKRYLKGRAAEMQVSEAELTKFVEKAQNVLLDPESFKEDPLIELKLAQAEKAFKLNPEDLDVDLEAGSAGELPIGAKAANKPEPVLPKFKSTGEAHAFGDIIPEEQKAKTVNMLDERIGSREEAKNKAVEAGDFQKAMDLAVENQFDNEARQQILGKTNPDALIKKKTPEPSAGEVDSALEAGATGAQPVAPKEPPAPTPLLRPGSDQTAATPVKTSGELKSSRLLERTKERLDSLASFDANYRKMNLANVAALSARFVEENPEAARRVAIGIEPPPQGVTELSVSIAYAESLRDAGKWYEMGQTVKSASMRATRYGQEIASLRGAVNENSPDHFIKQVLNARMEQAGRPLIAEREKNSKDIGRVQRKKTEAKIEKDVKEVISEIEAKDMDAAEAQKLIDSLIC